jgi:hypothetical protein
MGVSLPGHVVSFAGRFVELTGMADMGIVLGLANRHATDAGEDVAEFSRVGFLLRVDESSSVAHDLLSYGQKRLLSFLYYAAANPHIVIADELVNGLHYEWIEACLKEIQDRQSFLTSQNPILLDMLPFESEEAAQGTFILCSREVKDGRGTMVWRNMSDKEGADFFRAYETQALQVSEILRNKDLW